MKKIPEQRLIGVLQAVKNLAGTGYGVTIQAAANKILYADLPMGQIYYCLGRLEKQRLINSYLGGARGDQNWRGDRRKRYFAITEAGRSRLRQHILTISVSDDTVSAGQVDLSPRF